MSKIQYWLLIAGTKLFGMLYMILARRAIVSILPHAVRFEAVIRRALRV